MPRKGPAPKRPLVVDPVYGSPVVTQLVNRVLLDGKKSTAERIVYGALEGVRSKTDQDPVSVLKRALDNIRPALRPAALAAAVALSASAVTTPVAGAVDLDVSNRLLSQIKVVPLHGTD